MKRLLLSVLALVVVGPNVAFSKPIDPNSISYFLYNPWFRGQRQLFNLCRFNKDVIKALEITKDEQQQIKNVIEQNQQLYQSLLKQPRQRIVSRVGNMEESTLAPVPHPLTHQKMYESLQSILGKSRAKRVQEIDYQRHRTRKDLFTRLQSDTDLAEKLLTDAEKKSVLDVHREFLLRRQKLYTLTGTPKENQQTKGKFRQDYLAAINKALSPSVMKKWKKLMGKKFKGKISPEGSRDFSGSVWEG